MSRMICLLIGIVYAIALSFSPASAEEKPSAPDPAAILAFVQEPLAFDSFVFNGDQFPACQFEHPEQVEKLIGHYKLKTTFYDAKGSPVAAPQKQAGRYAAVVEIQSPYRTSKRFFTLYHLQGKQRWNARAVGASLTLPNGAAIDPKVAASQTDDIDYLTTKSFAAALAKDPAGAALLAGMHDLDDLRRAGKDVEGDRASFRDRQWWVNFKRKYYGYDKRYPERFVCPTPVEGKPAPTIRDGTPAEAGMKPDAAAAIDAACAALLKENNTGFGLCIVRRGVMVVNKGFGQALGKPVTAETPADLASTSKFLAAVLLLEMVDRGLIQLDEPIEKYLLPLQGIKVKRSMTVRDLYLHTAGFSGNFGDMWPDMEEVIADMYPALEVGVRHQYQGVGLALGSKTLEMMSGEALPYLFRNHLFEPLGCKQSTSGFSAFGSFSIPLDLAKIGQMVLNGGSYGDKYFFGPKTVAQMLPVKGKDRFAPDKTVRWGVGIKQLDSDGLSEQAFGHPGGSGSFLVIDPKYDLVIAQVRNTEGAPFEEWLKQKTRFFAAIMATIDREK
jgi:CubicO group peptidase (beta-lactamase class C family)